MKYCVLSHSDNSFRATELVQDELSWTKFGDQTIIFTENKQERLSDGFLKIDPKAVQDTEKRLFLVIQEGNSFLEEHPNTKIIVNKGRYLAVELSSQEVKDFTLQEKSLHWTIRPLPINRFVLETPEVVHREAVPWIQKLVSNVSSSSFRSYLSSLVQFPTRNSLSDHFLNAAKWSMDQMQNMGYQVRLQEITVGNSISYNVVADRIGQGERASEVILVTAHLDSVNHGERGNVNADAPGADDNGSGCAGLLEIARIMAAHPAEHNLRLILFGGEEQGLLGSTQYINGLNQAERAQIRAVINMDMIGGLNTTYPSVTLEGASVSQELLTNLASSARTFTSLQVQTSLNPYASDHVPFIDANIPAVLTIEGSDNSNPHIHTGNDILEHINMNLALEIVRMNVATTAIYLGVVRTANDRLLAEAFA